MSFNSFKKVLTNWSWEENIILEGLINIGLTRRLCEASNII